jgi:hypothetical protein
VFPPGEGWTWVDLYVVFYDPPTHSVRAPWWLRLTTRPGWRHCVTVEDQGPVWLTESIRDSGVDRMVSPRSPIPAFVRLGAKVVRVTGWKAPGFRARGVTTCVSFTKLQIGMTGAVLTVRPETLYRRLVADGHQVMEGRSNARS